ncbi:MAG: Fic family protein [Senegalia sp. (in: firmicutes)]|uniref:Fic family protein n=1 Tax=Senegalia sp. (in: firmicutes) TaxID=1924098 RepID=UPI003F97E23F
MSVKQAAKLWNISDRRVRVLCSEGKIPGIIKEGRAYKIPIGALKPVDERTFKGKNIPAEYEDLFKRIDSKKAELEKRRPLTKGELERLRDEFLIEFTYNSNAIEGSTLTLRETAMVLEGLTIDKKPLKEHLEAVGHKDAFEYIQELVSERVVLSEKIIKDIHSLVLIDRPQDRGVYRRLPVRIVGAKVDPPQPYLVESKIEELVKRYNSLDNKAHIIEKVARFHLDFEGIHTFIDGNGRTGRLILNLEIMKYGYPPISVKFTDRKKYYDCFHEYSEKCNASKMILMVAKYIEEEIDRYMLMLS